MTSVKEQQILAAAKAMWGRDRFGVDEPKANHDRLWEEEPKQVKLSYTDAARLALEAAKVVRERHESAKNKNASVVDEAVAAPVSVPREFWREVPCGHPPDPVAASVEDGWTCHCGRLLDPATALPEQPPEAPGPIVPCGKCGCYVAIPLDPTAND